VFTKTKNASFKLSLKTSFGNLKLQDKGNTRLSADEVILFYRWSYGQLELRIKIELFQVSVYMGVDHLKQINSAHKNDHKIALVYSRQLSAGN
jgi:hypothetical protein